MKIQTGQSERLTLLDKVNVCLQEFGDHVMHLVFDVTGQVDIARLQRAARLSLIQHPLMSKRLVKHGWQPRWHDRNPLELDSYQYCELITGQPRQQAVDDFLVRELNYDKEPMLKLRVVRGQIDTVCIKVSCVPIDGRGFLILVEDLLAIYERLRLQPDYCPPPGDMSQRSTKALVPLFKWYDVFKLVFFGLKNQLTDSRTAHNWQFPCNDGSEIDKRYHCHQFAPATMQAIYHYRKQAGLSFNDILLGAYYKALYDIIQPRKAGPYCILNTFDLRRYETVGAPDRVANYSSFINTNVSMEAGTDFAAAALSVHQSISERKAHFPGMTEGPFIWPILTFLPFALGSFIVKQLLKHRGERIPVFTNVGVINTEKMRVNGKPIFNVMPFAPLEFPPKLTVTLATSGDVISLSVGFSAQHFPPDQIASLFTKMEQLILQTCTHPQVEVA